MQYYESRGEGNSGLIQYDHAITIVPEPVLGITLSTFANKLYSQPDYFFQALLTNATDRKLLVEELQFQPAKSAPNQSRTNSQVGQLALPKTTLKAIMPSASNITMAPNETFSAIVALSKETDLLVS